MSNKKSTNTKPIKSEENNLTILKPVTNLAQVPKIFAQIGKNNTDFDKLDRCFEDNKRDW